MFKPKRFHGSDSQGHGGLIITPLLDLLISLIPILILGVVLTRINVVDVAVSKPVASLQKVAPNKFELSLKVKANQIELMLNGKLRTKTGKQSPESIAQLHTEFVAIKKEFPQEFELKIEPENETVLNNLMDLIDAAREVKSGDPELIRKDEATGKDIRVKYLFPKIVLRGVYT